METKTTNIFLAIVPPSGKEVHVKWVGHDSVDGAKKEISDLRKLLIGQKKKPYDCYVYEAEAPPFGLKSYELDEVDMNFYEEQDPVDEEEVQKKLNQAIYEVGILAKEEANLNKKV